MLQIDNFHNNLIANFLQNLSVNFQQTGLNTIFILKEKYHEIFIFMLNIGISIKNLFVRDTLLQNESFILHQRKKKGRERKKVVCIYRF